MMSSDEDPFELIKKGNAFEAACDYWGSAEYYSRSSICLRCRADGLSSRLRNADGSGEAGGGSDGRNCHSAKLENQRIIALYRAQSLEYMYKARHSLLEALQFENDRDRAQTLEVAKSGTGSLDPICSMISPGDRTKRNRIFELLFSGRCEALDGGTQSNSSMEQMCTSDRMNHAAAAKPNKDFNSSNSGAKKDDRQQSIESRLAELNSSLLPRVPCHHNSCSIRADDDESDNRMNEIRHGLGRLGVLLPESTRKNDLVDKHLTSGDQVKLIIQQATDEIRIESGVHTDGGGGSNEYADEHTYSNDDGIDENDSMFGGYEDVEYDIDALLTMAENLAAKSGFKLDGNGVFSQVMQIKKIQALLLKARFCLELDHSSQDGNEQPKEVSISEGSVENDQSAKGSKDAAVELIKNAHYCMQELLKHW